MRKVLCEHCGTRSACCIADLPDEDLDAFRAVSVSAIYKRRQVVFHEGQPATGLYMLCHGAVKVYQSDRFGRDHILAVTAPGDILGEMPLDPTETYTTSAEALVDSQLCFLARDRIVPFIEKHPQTGIRLIAALSASLSTARRKVRALALKSAESRLAELLLHLSSVSGEPGKNGSTHIKLTYTRREMAEMIGVSTETAIRLLGRLKLKKAINTAHRDIVVADADKLSRIANHDNTAAA